VSSFVAVALSCAFGSLAFAQDPPAPQPPAGAPTSQPPVAQQSGARPTALDQPGFDFGARLGYALPFGTIDGTDKLSDTFSGAVPIVLEAGYRLNPNITLGALFQYGFAQVKDDMVCTNGISCSGHVIRLGLEGIYNFNLDTPLTPWVGIGTGYEWMGVSFSGGGASGSVSARGFEFVSLHAGGDYRMSSQLAIGPFVSFSLAQYSHESLDVPGLGSGSMDVTDKKIHEWLQIGVRGKFGI
jgi:hypothetical protein